VSVRTDSLVLGLSVGLIGSSFGVVASAAGLSPWQALAMSALVFTGASQFAAVGVVAAGGSPLAAVAAGLFLGVRNAAYGFYLAPYIRGSLPAKLLQSHLVIDETAGMASAQATEAARREAFLTSGLALFTFWNASTFVGALAGDRIADPETFGLDVAIPAAFLALLWPHAQDRPGLAAALLGGVIALVTTPLLPPGLPIIAALLAIPVVLLMEDETR
jgi:4-azaleucine resistance transporter AzlC